MQPRPARGSMWCAARAPHDRTGHRAQRGDLRAPRDQSRPSPRHLGSSRRLLRAPGGRWGRGHRHRGGLGTRFRLALRARPAGERVSDQVGRSSRACEPHGTVVLAALGHAGGQGTSHWSQRELWAPGRVPEVNSREVPRKWRPSDIEAVIDGFCGRLASGAAGCAGVEINAGQYSLARQFLSGLTNPRGDQWGADRSLLRREVIQRCVSGRSGGCVALRLSCDELAPWAGITPEIAPGLAAELASIERGRRPRRHAHRGARFDLLGGCHPS